MVRSLSAAILLGSLVVFAVAQAPPSNNPPKHLPRSAQTREALDMEIDIPEGYRTHRHRVSEILKFVSESLAERKKDVAILVDVQSFREHSGDAAPFLESEVMLPALVKKASAREVLDWCGRDGMPQATYLVKNGRVVFVDRAAAEVPLLLDQRVALRLRETPILAAVEELADLTGISIQIDPRCADGGPRVVTLRAENDITARGVLTSWADQFDLKVLEDEDRVIVLPRAEYLKKLRAAAEEAKLEREIFEIRPAETRVRRSSPVGAP